MKLTNMDRADSILINMSKAELVTLVSDFHPNVSFRILQGYTKRDLRECIVRTVPPEVVINRGAAMHQKRKVFIEGLTKCSSYACKKSAQGWLLDQDGNTIPGSVSCRECSEMCIKEYGEKLNEAWTFAPGIVKNESGNTIRELLGLLK